MLISVEAEIDAGGNVRLLEKVEVTKPTRAIVTILENGEKSEKGTARSVLESLENNRLPRESRPSVEEIEEKIKEARESWD